MSFQPVSAYADSYQPTKFPALTLKGGRSALIELVTAVRHLLPVRLNDGAILALEDLISKTRPSDWTSEDTEPVCYAQACEVAKMRGVPTSTWRRHERALEQAGFIERRTDANGGRSKWKGTGIYFGPLIQLVPHLLALKDHAEAERKAAGHLIGERGIHKRHLRGALEELRLLGADPADIAALDEARDAWPSGEQLHRLSLADLQTHVEDADALCRKALDLVDTLSKGSKMSGQPVTNERSHIQVTTQIHSVSCNASDPEMCADKPAQDNSVAAEPTGSPDCRENKNAEGRAAIKSEFIAKLGPSRLYHLCSDEMRFYLDGRAASPDKLRIHDFTIVAHQRMHELGINKSVWNLGRRLIGEEAAMLCLLITDARRTDPDHPVYNPGGHMRGMVRAAERGELHLTQSLIGLSERRSREET